MNLKSTNNAIFLKKETIMSIFPFIRQINGILISKEIKSIC